LVADAVERLVGEVGAIEVEDEVEVLGGAPREVDLVQAAARGVDAIGAVMLPVAAVGVGVKELMVADGLAEAAAHGERLPKHRPLRLFTKTAIKRKWEKREGISAKCAWQK
jgi:hypothetical protein